MPCAGNGGVTEGDCGVERSNERSGTPELPLQMNLRHYIIEECVFLL